MLAKILEQSVADYTRPRLELEQYRTPPEVALRMANLGLGLCADGVTADFGSGTGMISYALALLGYKYVIGVEVDREAVKLSKSSPLYSLLANVDFVEADATRSPLRRPITCVVQNPPFGLQRRGMDALFLSSALSLKPRLVLSLHHYSREGIEYVARLCEKVGYKAQIAARIRFPLKWRYPHHRKRLHYIWVAILKCSGGDSE
jgi:putative methylase